MELIKSVSRRSFWSETLYNVLNASLAIGLLLLVRLFDPPILAVLLVLLSKWRIFAVRPRYWIMNIKSNLIDILVGLSTVSLLYHSNESLAFQIFITLLYGAWLLVLKPRAKRKWMILQAGTAQFVALTAIASFSHVLPSSVFVVAVAIIGYAVARHILSSYDEDSVELLSMVYAFVLAEIAWFYYHWMVAYPLVDEVAVPQLTIVALLLGFVGHRLYDIRKHNGKVTMNDARLPVLFMLGLLAVLFLRFTPWSIVL